MKRKAEQFENGAKSRFFTVRLSEEQRKLLARAARDQGVSIARYMRTAAMREALAEPDSR